ncbi:hypothetical protein IPF86_02935 [Candidatus Nomurabacteria bacterium]|nr:MAG: hypothetical protein IPF86_02935 [Candidatus Nomurabacteria bacterium]
MKSILAICILIAFATFGGFGMLAIAGMDGHHHEPGCPFMPGEQAICDMNASDHVTAWKNAFTVPLPMLFTYFLLAVAVLFVWKYYSPSDLFVRRLLPSRRDLASISLYQELFSGGILNPKAP